MTDIDFNPEAGDALHLTIDLTSTTYAFEVPKSFLTIQASEEGLIIDFISEEDGRVITGRALTYSGLYDILQEMEKNRKASIFRHPTSQLQLIDGGGNKAESN